MSKKKQGKHSAKAGPAGAPASDGAGRPDTPSTAAWMRESGARSDGAPGTVAEIEAIAPATAAGTVLWGPGQGRCDLSAIDPDGADDLGDKEDAKDELARQRERIAELQGRLYAEHKRSLLVVLQAIDTGGKDGTIRNVFEGVNPQGCQVASFKVPTAEELDHDFLWRYHARAPARGMITVFNRSHYEDVLVVRVKKLVSEEVVRQRYALINDFERLLAVSGTTILKFFLHISRAEQKERLEKRLKDPAKNWKFEIGDLKERESWDQYQDAFEAAIGACSTAIAPWHIVPSDRKWFRNVAVARTIADTLEAMDPAYPEPQKGLDHVVVPD